MIKIGAVLKQISKGLACQYAGDCLLRKKKLSLLSVHPNSLKKNTVVEFVSAVHEGKRQSIEILERSAA